VRRREFISLLSGAVAAWPIAARAQQPGRRIGILMSLAADDSQGQARHAGFIRRLRELGWTEGHNVGIETRWAAGNPVNTRKFAAELVALAPDVIFASGGTVVGALLQATSTVPVVFTGVADPVGGGLVASLARPGGNATGFTAFEYSTSGKWLELLRRSRPA
jgi:putative ABC transport system substrate-binding protein